MKIIIHSLDELLALSALVRPNNPIREGNRPESEAERYVSSGQFAAELAHAESAASYDDQPDGLPADIARPASVNPQDDEKVCTVVAEPGATDELPERDADGVPHSTDWHSDPPKINADGRWKARRGRDNDAYKAWLLEQAVEVAEAAVAADAEPVATETHALPQDELPEGVTRRAEGAEDLEVAEENAILEGDVEAPVDLAALVEASQEAALDASDSHMDLIKACQAFISHYGHPAYNALKAAVAPLEGAENGKAVPQFTPAERRLMRACIDNYPEP